MRTLKKVLALSMVFAMAFSMMAGAAFNDQDQIDASLVEDIQLLTALEVFQGDEKGDFNPTSNVTRAQAAKMIYVLKNNGQDDEAAAFKGQSVYSDVPSGHWAEGYINYATNLGIMSGWTEGSVRKFDPNGNVTGIELTKMLLCMIGYRADIQGYTGNGWQTNVLKDGAHSAITTNYLPTIYNAAPRQWTARLMANAINSPYISYSRGEVVQGSATRPDLSYGEQYLGLKMVEGYLKNAGKVALNLESNSVTLDDDGDQITISATPDLKTGGVIGDDSTGAIHTFKTTVDPSLLGQRVKVYYKSTTLTTTNAKVYAVLPTGSSKVYDVAMGDVTIGINKNGETIKFAGYNGGSAKTYYGTGNPDGADVQPIKLVKNLKTITPLTALLENNTADNGKEKKNFSVMSGNSNENIRFVDQDNDGVIDFAMTNDVTYAIVASHNPERNTIRFEDADGTALKLVNDAFVTNSEANYKKINFVNDVTTDDVVSVTLNRNNGTDVWDVAKVEPTSATVSGYSLNTDSTAYANVTINGESTKFAKNKMGDYDNSVNGSVMNDTTFYTDGKYIVYSKGGENAASVSNLAYVIAKQSYTAWQGEADTWHVKVLLSDGTQGQYEVAATYKTVDENGKKVSKKTVDENGKAAVDGSLLQAGKVMSYSLSNNKITLKELLGDSTISFDNGVQKYKNATKTLNIGDGSKTYKVADEAYFFVKSNVSSGTKYSVVKASELGRDLESTSSNSFATKTVGGIPSVVFGTLELNTSAISTGADYAFVKSFATYSQVDGEHTIQMTVVDPTGADVVIKKTFSDAASANTDIATWRTLRGKVVSYTIDTDGNVETIDKIANEDITNTLTAGKWSKVVVEGWNSNSAYVKLALGEKDSVAGTVVNVASDVKVHVVNTTDEDYAVYSDGSVEKTALEVDAEGNEVSPAKYGHFSAFVYVQEVNSQPTITDIFTVEVGGDAAKLWN